MIPYSKQTIDKQDIKSVLAALNSPCLTQGPKIQEFERALARAGGIRYAIAASSGTAALHLAYLAAGLGRGDEVITTPNTFAATANMLLAAHAKPVFCDIRMDTYNLDENKIEELITKRTKAIAVVDFAGQPCEYGKLRQIAKKYKLILIADSCHSLGGRYQGRPVGSFADMSVFSFHPVKSITTGEGGAVLTNDSKYYERLKLFRNHGIYKDKAGKNVMVELGFNYRLSDIHASLGTSQLKKLKSFIQKRNQVVKWYKKELKGLDAVVLPQTLRGSYSAWHLYAVRLKNPKLRDKLWQYLGKKGIGANFHYPAVYGHPYYRKNGYAKLRLPNEEIYQSSCLTLPLFPGLKEVEVKYICQQVKDFFKKHD